MTVGQLATRGVVVGGIEHEVVTPGPLVPGVVVRLGCRALYVVGAGVKSEPVGRCPGCFEGNQVSYTESNDGTIMLDDGTVLPPLDDDEIEPWASEAAEDGRP